MSKQQKPVGDERIAYEGTILEIVEQDMQLGQKVVTFERARRAPGTRLIIVNPEEKTVLLTKEFRYELNDFDYRLPGGKVVDTLDEYHKLLTKGKEAIEAAAEAKAKEEAKEEAGVEVKNIRHFVTLQAGATVTWDLMYYIVEDHDDHADGQELGHGEDIEKVWVSWDEAKKHCLDGTVSEARSAVALLRYFAEVENV